MPMSCSLYQTGDEEPFLLTAGVKVVDFHGFDGAPRILSDSIDCSKQTLFTGE